MYPFTLERPASLADAAKLATAGGEPIAPASPQPFEPIGLCVQGVLIVSSLKFGKSAARGIA